MWKEKKNKSPEVKRWKSIPEDLTIFLSLRKYYKKEVVILTLLYLSEIEA